MFCFSPLIINSRRKARGGAGTANTFAVFLQYFCSTFSVFTVLFQYLQYLQYFFSTCSTFLVLFQYFCSICSILQYFQYFSYAVPGPPLIIFWNVLSSSNFYKLYISSLDTIIACYPEYSYHCHTNRGGMA